MIHPTIVEQGINPIWVIVVLMSAISVLSAAIVYMYKQNQRTPAKLAAAMDLLKDVVALLAERVNTQTTSLEKGIDDIKQCCEVLKQKIYKL